MTETNANTATEELGGKEQREKVEAPMATAEKIKEDPLLRAIHAGQYKNAESVLLEGRNPNAGDPLPIHLVTAYKNLSMLRLLLRFGVNPWGRIENWADSEDIRNLPFFCNYAYQKDSDPRFDTLLYAATILEASLREWVTGSSLDFTKDVDLDAATAEKLRTVRREIFPRLTRLHGDWLRKQGLKDVDEWTEENAEGIEKKTDAFFRDMQKALPQWAKAAGFVPSASITPLVKTVSAVFTMVDAGVKDAAQSPLFTAVQEKDFDKARNLLIAGAHPDEGKYGTEVSPICGAIGSADTDGQDPRILELLLRHGANPWGPAKDWKFGMRRLPLFVNTYETGVYDRRFAFMLWAATMMEVKIREVVTGRPYDFEERVELFDSLARIGMMNFIRNRGEYVDFDKVAEENFDPALVKWPNADMKEMFRALRIKMMPHFLDLYHQWVERFGIFDQNQEGSARDKRDQLSRRCLIFKRVTDKQFPKWLEEAGFSPVPTTSLVDIDNALCVELMREKAKMEDEKERLSPRMRTAHVKGPNGEKGKTFYGHWYRMENGMMLSF